MCIQPPPLPSRCCILVAAALTLTTSPPIAAADQSPLRIELLSPRTDEVALARKPDIAFRFLPHRPAGEYLVLLDGNDVTALLEERDGGHRLAPLSPLPPGQHSLYILAYDGELPVEQTFTFVTRHSETFEEFYSDNRLSATLKTVLNRRFSTSGENAGTAFAQEDFPYTSFDAYLGSSTAGREGKWTTSFNTDLRYYDQNAALGTTAAAPAISVAAPQVQDFQKKYLSLLDFLFAASYASETRSALFEIGDTTIDESRNTIENLARRGGRLSYHFANTTLNAFTVLGQETGYEIDGLGFGFNSNDHLMGGSAKLEWFDRKLALKAIYSNGGDQGNYLGSWYASQGRKGEVAGILLVSDFYDQRLMTDFEFDASTFDGDTGDDCPDAYDVAYRLRLSGTTEKYDYDLSYRYAGPQYQVVGNQSVVRDWAGFDFIGGRNFTNQALRLLLNYSWDNVEDEPIFARIHSFTTGLDYRYSGWQRFPVGLLIEYNNQRSSDEPADIEPVSLDTGAITGSIGYLDGPWAVDLRSSVSSQDDHSPNDRDTRLFTLSFAPSYNRTLFSILPSWTLNSAKDLGSGVRTDTNTLTLDLYASFLNDQMSCTLGGTYDWTTSDDNSIDLDNTSVHGRLNYRIAPRWRLEESVVALEYTYTRLDDQVYDTTAYQGILSLVFSSSLPYSY